MFFSPENTLLPRSSCYTCVNACWIFREFCPPRRVWKEELAKWFVSNPLYEIGLRLVNRKCFPQLFQGKAPGENHAYQVCERVC